MMPVRFLSALLSSVVAVQAIVVPSPDKHSLPERQQLETRQQPGVIATSQFLRRGKHASVVCGNWVYIDGGDFSYETGGSANFEYSTTILSIDLSSSWVNSTVTIQSTAKPSDVPTLDFGSLWCNESSGSVISGFAGVISSWNTNTDLPSLSLWSFTPDNTGSGSWSEVLAPGASALSNVNRPYAGLMAYGGDSAYILGGLTLTNGSTDYYLGGTPLPGIIGYNMTTNTFSNASASGYNINGTAESGVLQYVPSFGPKGVYVAMGGDYSPLDHYTPGSKLKSFANITVFDPVSGKFYNQTATGNLPQPRTQFCTAGAANSNGTYEIFLYAGWGTNLGSAAVPFDEVYILTLPAFQWIKVNYAPQTPRHTHTCHTVGNRQMLIIGGVDSSSTSGASSLDEDTFATADQFAQGLAIFDMTSLTFAEKYDADAEAYVQSDLVQNFYAANSKTPTWGSSELETLFQTTHFPNATSTATNSTSSGSSTSSTASSTSTSTSSTSHTGAIAGGVVGGIAGLALIAGLIFFFLRRKRSSKDASAHPGNELPAHSTNAAPYQDKTHYGSPPGPTYSPIVELGAPKTDRQELATPKTERQELGGSGPTEHPRHELP